jgi:hypothetical protein
VLSKKPNSAFSKFSRIGRGEFLVRHRAHPLSVLLSGKPGAVQCITPAQTISVHENDPAQHTTVINARFAMALREKGPQTVHLLLRQPIQVIHLQSPQGA